MSNEQHLAPRFTFPKAEHLKSRKAIEHLFKTGKQLYVRPYKVFYQVQSNGSAPSLANEPPLDPNTPLTPTPIAQAAAEGILKDGLIATPILPPLQAGFAVSTRNFKHAVDRNRVKRIGREAYRLNKQPLINLLAVKNLQLQVFFVYTDKTLPNFGEAEAAMKACLGKLQAIITKR